MLAVLTSLVTHIMLLSNDMNRDMKHFGFKHQRESKQNSDNNNLSSTHLFTDKKVTM
jgi:hypothetical protein